MRPYFRDDEAPSAERLAAYADGQLDASTRQEVQAWLARHPDLAAEVEAHGRLMDIWQSATVPEPPEKEWLRVLACLRAGPAIAAAKQPVLGGRIRRAHVLSLTAAAAVAAALLFTIGRPPEEGGETPESALLSVLSESEVEIISIDAADRRSLVVGEPPVNEPLVLASAGDVKLQNIEADIDGMVPVIEEGPATPMIVAPLDGGARVP